MKIKKNLIKKRKTIKCNLHTNLADFGLNFKKGGRI